MTRSVRVTSLQALRRETLRKFRQVGWWGTLKHGSGRMVRELRLLVSRQATERDPFDVAYGTDTGGTVGVGFLDIPDALLEHAVDYGAISEEEFTRLMGELPITADGLVFVDLGAGKGRALLLASLYPFAEIVGVELCRMLHEIATANIRAFRDPRQRCREIRAICEDAAKYAMPDGPLLVFMFNPFYHKVMRAVCSHLERSLDRGERNVCVWYIKPECREVFDESPYFELVKDTGRYVFYRGRSPSAAVEQAR